MKALVFPVQVQVYASYWVIGIGCLSPQRGQDPEKAIGAVLAEYLPHSKPDQTLHGTNTFKLPVDMFAS